jgi:hypothetical protein
MIGEKRNGGLLSLGANQMRSIPVSGGSAELTACGAKLSLATKTAFRLTQLGSIFLAYSPRSILTIEQSSIGRA